jgi:hypothetical protein
MFPNDVKILPSSKESILFEPKITNRTNGLTSLEMVKRLSQRKAISQVSGEKPLIRCHLSFKQKGVYEKSDSHKDKENRRSQSGMQVNGY